MISFFIGLYLFGLIFAFITIKKYIEHIEVWHIIVYWLCWPATWLILIIIIFERSMNDK